MSDFLNRLRSGVPAQLEKTLREIETLDDPTVYKALLEGLHWKPAQRRSNKEQYMRGFGKLELNFESSSQGPIARRGWQEFIALRLICSSPQHQELKTAIHHLSMPRLPLGGISLPRLERLPNLYSLHLYLDEEPAAPLNLALPQLRELSLFGPGFRTLQGVQEAPHLKELDLRWQTPPDLTPLRGARRLQRAYISCHEGVCDLGPLAVTSLVELSAYGPELACKELTSSPHLRKLTLTTEGPCELGNPQCALEELQVERASGCLLGTLPKLREASFLGGYPNGMNLQLSASLPSLEQLTVIMYEKPGPHLAHCPALKFLRARPYDCYGEFSLPGVAKCTQLREVELWAGHPAVPELGELPRLQRVLPYPYPQPPKEDERSQITESDLGENLEWILHSSTEHHKAERELRSWLAAPGSLELFHKLWQEVKVTEVGQFLIPRGSYLRGNPEEREDTWDRENRPRTSASYRQALLRFVALRTAGLRTANLESAVLPTADLKTTDLQTSNLDDALSGIDTYLEQREDEEIDLSYLGAFPSLHTVSLSAPVFRHLHALRDLPALRQLRLCGGWSEDLSSLAGLDRLESLSIDQPLAVEPLQNLSGIERLPNLRRLELRLASNPNLQALAHSSVRELLVMTSERPQLPQNLSLDTLEGQDLW